jgi:hypothetical protein
LPESQVESPAADQKGQSSLEASLQALWEKARRVSELLLQMRESNQLLHGRVTDLEYAEHQLKETLAGREKDLERLRHEVAKLQLNGSEAFTKEEKEALKAKIKEMVAKINARL